MASCKNTSKAMQDCNAIKPKPLILNIEHLSLSINRQTILEDINLTLAEREILTLIGPNGSGKSSLIRIILGLMPATNGKVTLSRNLRIGYMPQHVKIDGLMPLSVCRFLLLGGQQKQERLCEVLDEVGALNTINAPIQSISGGEMQRVLLARALLRKPEFLVLDEPVQGVDFNGQLALYQLIQEIRDRYRCSILMISHDLHLVMAATDRVICLNRHICCSGAPETITQDPAYHNLFGTHQVALYSHNHDHSHDLHGDIIKESSIQQDNRGERKNNG